MLCDQADVEHRLQIDFTVDPEPVVTALIAAAQGHIEREYGGPVEAADYVDELHHGRGAILLRHVPVNAVTSISEDGTALVVVDDIVWYQSGIVERVADGLAHPWGTDKLTGVAVTYNAGYAPGDIPADIVDVCAWMVVSAFRRGQAFAEQAGVESESVGDYTVAYIESLADPADLVHMTDEQRDIVGYYRTPVLA